MLTCTHIHSCRPDNTAIFECCPLVSQNCTVELSLKMQKPNTRLREKNPPKTYYIKTLKSVIVIIGFTVKVISGSWCLVDKYI